MTTYCIASAKGGSGKTILCACVGAFLAEIGKKVLLVDLDHATHGMSLLYLDQVNRHRSAAGDKPSGVFDGDSFSYDRDIVNLRTRVDFLPATFTFQVDYAGSEAATFLSVLEQVIGTAKTKEYDYVFLDAQAGGDVYSRIAMNTDIADEVVIVSEYDPLSAAGVDRLRVNLGKDLGYARTWLLMNKMLPDFIDRYRDFLEVMRYLSPIPWNPDVVRAYNRRALPLDLLYGNEFTLALMKTLKQLLDDDAGADMDAWTEGRAARIREPIETQYAAVQEEMSMLTEERKRRAGANSSIDFMMYTGAALGVILGAAYAGRDTLGLSDATSYSILVLIAGVVASFFVLPAVRRRIGMDKLEDERIVLRIRVLEEELKRLDVLRKADVNTLMTQPGG